MSARIHRYQVPVDDQVHVIELNGTPAHVGCRDPEVVEFSTPSGVAEAKRLAGAGAAEVEE